MQINPGFPGKILYDQVSREWNVHCFVRSVSGFFDVKGPACHHASAGHY